MVHFFSLALCVVLIDNFAKANEGRCTKGMAESEFAAALQSMSGLRWTISKNNKAERAPRIILISGHTPHL
jgi:hypothetical protein